MSPRHYYAFESVVAKKMDKQSRVEQHHSSSPYDSSICICSMSRSLCVLATCLLLLASGCSLFGDGPSAPVALPVEALAKTPVEVTVGGKTLVLDTYMWRNFQPIAPPDGDPLVALFYITTADSSDIPAGLEATAAWVVHEEEVWSTYFTGQEPPPGDDLSYRLFEVARSGPTFGPGVTVNAIVRLETRSGNTHLLRAADQYIERVE